MSFYESEVERQNQNSKCLRCPGPELYYKPLQKWRERTGPDSYSEEFTILAWIGAELDISKERGLKNTEDFMQWMSPKSYREVEQKDPQVSSNYSPLFFKNLH